MSFKQRWRAWRGYRPELSVEAIAVISCVFFALLCNQSFWRNALVGYAWSDPGTWRFVISTFIAITALHLVLLLVVLNRWTLKPLLSMLFIATEMATYHQDHYGVFLDVDMLRNVLHTEFKEARELLTFDLLWHVLIYAVLPIVLLWRLRIARQRWRVATVIRVLSVATAIGVMAIAMLVGFRDLSSLMRNQKALRYLVTPGNYLYASGLVLLSDVDHVNRKLIAVGSDAQRAPRTATAPPRLIVLIVGETVRAANWGLSGYARDTTPQLRALAVQNFASVSSCGTATEVSLPCMFAQIGRRDYDAARIRAEESLLHVLDHAGVATLWRDNQTGCKGVCAGLPFEQLNAADDADLCDGGLCHDEILLKNLQAQIDQHVGDLLVVLHPLGNHGPSYYARYPEKFRRYTPTCDSAELGSCSNQQITNSYDNAVLYADQFIAETIRLLQRQTTRDTALIYVSDHGESLGEHGLFLHGLPYAIAPKEQTSVPMIAWFSEGLASDIGLDRVCLNRVAAQPVSHDNLFHSVLGLFDVRTRSYQPALDLLHGCRSAAV